MKVIPKKNDDSGDAVTQAKQLEETGNLDKAAAIFEKLINADPLNENAYTRLMIIYRKNKAYNKELAIIKKGIASFERSFKTSSRITVTKKIASLSKSLLKSVGLTDKAGKALYEREPLGKWKKRRLAVERLIEKNKKRKK